jgi:hypothetical protein
VQARLREAGPHAAEVGLELGQLLEASRVRAAGVHVIPSFRRRLAALALLG